MSSTHAPASRAELLLRARLEARAIRGRTAFIRQARLLPLGIPLAALAALAAVAGARSEPRPIWRRHSRRARREDALRAAALGLLAGGGALGATWIAASAEWTRDERRRRGES